MKLRDFFEFIARMASERGESFSEDFADAIEQQLRREYPGERIYIVPPSSNKDPARGEMIRALSKRLPQAIVAERLGISRQNVSYHLKNRPHPAGRK